MNILFFQNCVSPHQMPYIRHLWDMDEINDVIVISPVDDLVERKNMGWGRGNNHAENLVDGVTILISPSDTKIKDLFAKYENHETWCVFSGINAFPEVAAWFRMSIGYNVRRGIITEPPYIYEHPLWQHAIRFAFKDWKYTKFIDKFFVMGDEYLWYYRMWSKKWDVIPFMYCTEWRDRSIPSPSSEKLKILYVGALSQRKNVAELLAAINDLGDKRTKVELGIVGDGEEMPNLRKMVAMSHYCTETVFYGSKSMDKIPEIMQKYDILVLPSKHDGWGAVVNEALTLGLYVICSDKCGAKYLLKDETNGMTYKGGNYKELTSCLFLCIDKLNEIRNTLDNRVIWAKKHISGAAVADYFNNCLRKQ